MAASEANDSSREQQELALDLTQFLLDIAGIFEPTPFADASNALISLGRGDWLGAGLSAISILPYLGDFAKLGKLPKYARSVERAVELAANNTQFADKIRPILSKLKSLLDDVPADQLPDSLRRIRAQVDKFLADMPTLTGPVRKALDQLPANLREGFLAAMKQPPLRNPRKLRKHPGPVDEDRLIEELRSKQFVQVKQGQHSLTGGGEDSDIYLRRIMGEDGRHYFETIRVDRKALPSNHFRPHPNDAAKSVGQIQAEAKSFRRAHHTMGQTSRVAPLGQGGNQVLTTGLRNQMIEQLDQGARKGAFSHWHHERFLATPENLATYLQRPLKGTQKLDPVGESL